MTWPRDDVQMLVGALEDEVTNGGFDQFFFNQAGNRAAETIEALEAIGAHKTADIVRRACARFPSGMPPADRFPRQDLLDVVSPESDGFEQEDQDFYAYEEDLAALVASYVQSGARQPKPTPVDQRGIAALRKVAVDLQLTEDGLDDARRLNASLLAATGGVDAYSLLPNPARLPFDVPPSLQFAIPVAVPETRQKKVAARRLVKDLRDPNPNVRRAAAFDLGGWPPRDDVDQELVDALAREADLYVRAVMMLSVAIRNSSTDVDLVAAAGPVVEAAQQPEAGALRSMAGSIAVLAGTIAVVRSNSAGCEDVARLAKSLAHVERERERAQALLAVVTENY